MIWNQLMWNKIKELTDQHGYMSGVDRMSERVKGTGEVFTPTDLVIEIVRKIPVENFAPGKTVLDPACGDGQFLEVVKHLKMLHFGMTLEAALNDIYGVDIMRDNVTLCLKRLGGGHILTGNTLEPDVMIEGQTYEEHLKMRELFGTHSLEEFF
jgi:2-polyprenyl-3-methyl-5-hydroxy-6-metoxy-1,4-benzoquinol methylase